MALGIVFGFGAVVGFLEGLPESVPQIVAAVFFGVSMGLTASGLYDVYKDR